ncbi:hypothetical protein [Bradyrhizobium sp.]|uniref:hypothetical protein n=1 Tax=Bradyrhizobium sp. TaxID=376 RepID=UPI002DFA97F0|nr:hypothetical protein [Bradyrhizobium sp.]
MAITFLRFKEYLDKIDAQGFSSAGDSGHGFFWQIDYNSFITGTVPNKQCEGKPVPLIDPNNKLDTAFFQILQGQWCAKPQMPKTGPFVTDANYKITLNDGTEISGQKILDDIKEWLRAGAPENG